MDLSSNIFKYKGMEKQYFAILLLLMPFSIKAQIQKPVIWSYAAKKISQTEVAIYLKATIDDGWHIYSSNQKGEGPVKTSFRFVSSKDFSLIGRVIEPKPVTKYEETFEMDISYFEKSVVFQQKVKLNRPITVVKGSLEFMACTDKQCLPAETINFSIPIK